MQYNQDIVEIFYNHTRITSHKRSFKPGYYNTIADHKLSTHQAYNSWSPQFFEDQAIMVGPSAVEYIKRLICQYAYPEIGYKQCQGILALGRDYTNKILENACLRALEYHKAS